MVTLLLAILYLCFVSLGLPDSVLGSAWPTMFVEFGVPVSFAGIVSAIVAVGTVVSSLFSDRITKKFGAARTTVISIFMTAAALFGFSVSTQFWMVVLFAIPYGLGAGSVDAALNNYVALHFASRHMSWLHCMWGIGAATGPAIMGYALTVGAGWHTGYFTLFLIQAVICAIVLISTPIWKKGNDDSEDKTFAPISLRDVLKIKGAVAVMVNFFCYCALEATVMLWASSYLNIYRGVNAETAALFGGLYVLGVTVGRAISGFATIRLNDTQMTRIGYTLMVLGVGLIALPLQSVFSLVGLVVLGVGSAPIYPCIIHSTPERFGKDKSGALIGVQMASAYTGTCLAPPIFGFIANYISIALLPLYLALFVIAFIVLFEVLVNQTKTRQS